MDGVAPSAEDSTEAGPRQPAAVPQAEQIRSPEALQEDVIDLDSDSSNDDADLQCDRPGAFEVDLEMPLRFADWKRLPRTGMCDYTWCRHALSTGPHAPYVDNLAFGVFVIRIKDCPIMVSERDQGPDRVHHQSSPGIA